MIRITHKLAWLACAAALLAPSIANAQSAVPATISYQGRLLKSDGTPESGVIQFDFGVFSAASGGTALWTESQQVGLTSGFYQLFLGSVTPIPSTLFDGTDRYLEVTVAGSVLTPRQKMASVPYAMLAGVSKSVNAGGLVLDSSGLHTNQHTVVLASGIISTNAIDPTAVQLRVTGTCSGSTFIAGINSDGSVSCTGINNSAFIQNGTAQQTGAFNVSGAGTVGGDFSVSGNTTLGAVSATSANVGGDLDVTGSATAGTALLGTWPHDGASAMFAANQGAAAGDYANSYAMVQSADGLNVYLNHGADGGIHFTSNGGSDLVTFGDNAVTFAAPSVSFPGVGSSGMTIDSTGITIGGKSVVNSSGGISSGAIDTTAFQARVNNTCAATSGITAIGADGTVTCRTADASNTAFIHNGTAQQPSTSFNIGGSGQTGGAFAAGGTLSGVGTLTLTGAAVITNSPPNTNYVIAPQGSSVNLATDYGLGQTGAVTRLNHTAGGMTQILSGNSVNYVSFNDLAVNTSAPGITFNQPIVATTAAGNAAIVTFEHSNGTQGIGIGYNTVRTTGSAANQDLHFAAQGSGAFYLDEIAATGAVPSLYFGSSGLNSDPIYFSRTALGSNQSDLVLNLGDDLNTGAASTGDRFRIAAAGTAFADTTGDLIRVETAASTNGNRALVTINPATTINGALTLNGAVTMNGQLSLSCRAGFTAIADGHLCFGNTMQTAGSMDTAIGTCQAMQPHTHVCTAAEYQQACGAGFSAPFGGVQPGWYGDHGANSTSGANPTNGVIYNLGLTDDFFLTWNSTSCNTNNDALSQVRPTVLPYRCCY